jgi:hypothetical protein
MSDEPRRRCLTDVILSLIFGAVFYFLQEALQTLIVLPELHDEM